MMARSDSIAIALMVLSILAFVSTLLLAVFS